MSGGLLSYQIWEGILSGGDNVRGDYVRGDNVLDSSVRPSVSHVGGNKRRFQLKVANFPTHPHVYCTPAEGVALGIGYRSRGSKIRIIWLPGREGS